jgi:hypothetical protein
MSLSQRVRSLKGRHGVTALVSFSFVFSAIVRPSFIIILDQSRQFNSAITVPADLTRFFYTLVGKFLNAEKTFARFSQGCDLQAGPNSKKLLCIGLRRWGAVALLLRHAA